MSISSKRKSVRTLSATALAPIVFHAIVGVLFLVLLPLANYPPHIGLTGVMNLIAAYGLLTKRSWAKWLIFVLFLVATTLSLCTLYYVIFSDWFVSLSMIVYFVLECLFTARVFSKGKVPETVA